MNEDIELAAMAGGFLNAGELFLLVAAVDLSTDAKKAAFNRWKRDDGTKAGLLKLMNQKPSPPAEAKSA